MGMIDLKCRDSITSSTDYCCADRQREYLLLGHNYQIYLFFDLPPCLCSVVQARLILFKLLPFPFTARQSVCADNRYNLYPLLDFYSSYSGMFSPPPIDFSRRVIFENNYCCSYTEIDITHIVKDWASDKIENYGVLLTGDNNSGYISYASDRYEVTGMRPMLRLTYKGITLCQPLSVAPCSVAVSK